MADGNGQGDLSDRPVSELVKQLADQMTALMRQEVELAKAELTAKGRRAGVGAGLFGTAGVLAWFGLGALTAAAVLALATALDAWLAALLVAAAHLAVAGLLALMGRSKTQAAAPPVPEQAVESVKEDLRVTKERMREARR